MGPGLDAAVILMAWSCTAVPVVSPGVCVPLKTALKRTKNFQFPVNAPLSRTAHLEMKRVCKHFHIWAIAGPSSVLKAELENKSSG